jgi:hypothetical protein
MASKDGRAVVIEIIGCLRTAVEAYQKANPRPQHEEPFPYLEETCKGLAELLGFFEGLACLGGVPEKDRLKTRLVHLRKGKRGALESHEQSQCDGCEGSKHLKAELETN